GTRPIYANSAYATYRWARRIAESWRTDTDIGFPHAVEWVNVLRNLDHDAAHPGAAGPGHWNDPDYLGPELGMTSSQAGAQLSMWAMVAAPLILGSDPRALSPVTIAMLTNREVIAVDQDPLGIQGTIADQLGSGQVWRRLLAGGSVAVALLNRGSAPLRISTSARRVGLAESRAYTVRDLWAHRSTKSGGEISAVVAPDSVVLYRVAAVAG
ncbi:MAG: glycoside hydrolase family 27 protein, partial [Mycobacterium sp.]|nr:glycoside hydrolase family 27 protein [Mycobacterium sp.]